MRRAAASTAPASSVMRSGVYVAAIPLRLMDAMTSAKRIFGAMACDAGMDDGEVTPRC